MSNTENVKAFIKRRKANLITVFDSKCCICGWDAYQEGLEFHHVNPKEKEFGICASNAVTKALDKQLAEMRKCILVCANCHRGIHQGYIQIPENWQSLFNEETANKLQNELKLTRQGKMHLCPQCGKTISKDAELCVDCWNKKQRQVVRPNRDTLKQLIRTTPFTKIGEKYGVSDNAIRKWCETEGLPRRVSDIKKYSDEEWELL